MRIIKIKIEVEQGIIEASEKTKSNACVFDSLSLQFLNKIKAHIDGKILEAVKMEKKKKENK